MEQLAFISAFPPVLSSMSSTPQVLSLNGDTHSLFLLIIASAYSIIFDLHSLTSSSPLRFISAEVNGYSYFLALN